MKYILLSMALMLSSSVNAAIITYSWDDHLTRFDTYDGPDEDYLPPIEEATFDASGSFSFDSAERTLIAARVNSSPVNFEWQGSLPIEFEGEPLPYSPYPVEALFLLDVENYHLALYFDRIFVKAGDDFFFQFDEALLVEGAQITAMQMYQGVFREVNYALRGQLSLESIVEPSKVPEPSGLALLALGLLGLAGANSRGAK